MFTVGACCNTSRRGPPALLPGACVWRHAWGNGANRPSGRHCATYRSLNHPSMWASNRSEEFKISVGSAVPEKQ